MTELTQAHPAVLTSKGLPSVSLREWPQSVLVQAVTEKPDLKSITARVTVLLSNYFEKSVSQDTADALLENWVDHLADFPYWVVDYACRRWEKMDRRKPTPADIVKLASDRMLMCRDELERRYQSKLPPPEPHAPLTLEEKRNRAMVADQYLKKFGFGKFSRTRKANSVPHWSDGMTVEEENERMAEARKSYRVDAG